MKRAHLVDQRENDRGDFWYTVRGGNGENVLTSKMYTERWRAVRAARAYIRSINPVAVRFSYWTGAIYLTGTLADTHVHDARRRVVERIR